MSEINFQPVFDYIDQNNHVLKEEIRNEFSGEFREIKTSIANLSGQVKQYHQELLVAGHRLDRLEGWAGNVGDKVGLPIKF